MTTKSYSKHNEYKTYSSSGSVPYTDEQFDMIKSDLLPKGSKLNSLGRNGGSREYHYEYKEESLPSGKYDRKDLRTVEEFTVPGKTAESSTYFYKKEERDLPAVNSGTRTYNYESSINTTPGYSKVKSSKTTKDLSHNVEELDSLLDDLQKDQERQLYKSGYTSDTAESSSFDYRRGTPVKPVPSSGYSTLKREERMESSSWGSSPPPQTLRTGELRQELYREEKTESRVVPSQVSPAIPQVVPQAVCTHCHQPNTGTLSRSSTPMNKVTTTVKTYTYEVPAGQDPTTLPIPPHADHQHTYVSSTENLRTSSSSAPLVSCPPCPPPGGCQYCSHCNSQIREYRTVTTTDVSDHTKERLVGPVPPTTLSPPEPHTGRGPHGPSSYKYSETTYSSHNSTQRFPSPSPGPFPRGASPLPPPSPSHNQQTPKRLDDLLADFPEARFPTQPDGVVRRKIEVTHENSSQSRDVTTPKPTGPAVPGPPTKNVTGPAVYYPPGHTPFAKKDTPVGAVAGYQSSAMQGGGAYASGRGMYEYESGARSKEKHSETKTAVPVCLPLCCAMPCVIM